MKLFKIFTIAALATMALVSCKSDDDPVEASLPEVTISGTTIENVTVKLSKTSEVAVSVVLESDNADFTVTSPVSIAAGKTTANVTVTPASGLAAGTYNPTITLKSAEGATIGSASSVKLTYEVANQGGGDETGDGETGGDSDVAGTAIDFDNIKTLDLGNKEFACFYYFQEPIEIKGNMTIVFNVYLDEATGQQPFMRFGDGKDDQEYMHFMRFGEGGHGAGVLEDMLCEPGVATDARPKGYFDELQANTWYTMAITGDETGKYILYTDGYMSAEIQSSKGAPDFGFQSIGFAESWGQSYRKPFAGNVCGISIWTRTLTADEVASLTGKAPKLDAEGLAAYWAFDEGEGTLVDEKTGRYEDIDFTKSTHNNNDSQTVNEIFDNTENMLWN